MATQRKSTWFDESTHEPLIAEHAQKLQTFLDAFADGHIDEKELAAQENRLLALMKEVEPLLDEALHDKVTRLLCELTAYDIMQAVFTMQDSRPKTTFQG